MMTIGVGMLSVIAAAVATAGSITVGSPVAKHYTCGSLPFRPRALDRPANLEKRDTPLGRAVHEVVTGNDSPDPFLPRHRWRLLARKYGRADVEHPARHPTLMTFTRRHGRWSWEGSGDCVIRAYRHGLSAVGWRVAPNTTIPEDATEVPVLVQEENCSSGRVATGRIEAPWVFYGRRRIVVTYFVTPLKGAQTCQSSPPTATTLVLEEPRGERKIVDGGPLPRRRAAA